MKKIGCVQHDCDECKKREPMDDLTIRGHLAANLSCWHRLTEAESDELVAFFKTQATPEESSAVGEREALIADLRHPKPLVEDMDVGDFLNLVMDYACQAADMLAADAREIQILQAEVDLYRAACDKRDAALDALKKQEPVAYLAWRDGKPCYEGDDAVCEDAVWPVDSDDDRTSTPVYLAAGAQQVAVPQGWTDDQMNRFAWSCINPRLGADSIRERLHAFREQEALRGIVAPQPSQGEVK